MAVFFSGLDGQAKWPTIIVVPSQEKVSQVFSRAQKVQRQFYLLTTLSAWAFSIAHLVIWKKTWLFWKFTAFLLNIHEDSSKTAFYSDWEKFGIICFLNFDWKLVLHIKGSFICSEGIKVKLDGDEEKIGLLKSLVKVIFFRESKLGQKCDICSILLIFRPISASFLIRTSGKEYHSQADY